MKAFGVILIFIGVGLIYGAVATGKSVMDMWSAAVSFLQPPKQG